MLTDLVKRCGPAISAFEFGPVHRLDGNVNGFSTAYCQDYFPLPSLYRSPAGQL